MSRSFTFNRISLFWLDTSLSWADTAASVFGRLYGHRTAKLPKTLFGVLPLAARKSLAGSTAAFITGLVTAATFWGLCSGGLGGKLGNPVWNWDQRKTGGLGGLAVLSVGVGIITSITEALGTEDSGQRYTRGPLTFQKTSDF